MDDHPSRPAVTLVLGPPTPERLLGLRQWALEADRTHPFSVLYLAPSAYLRERLTWEWARSRGSSGIRLYTVGSLARTLAAEMLPRPADAPPYLRQRLLRQVLRDCAPQLQVLAPGKEGTSAGLLQELERLFPVLKEQGLAPAATYPGEVTLAERCRQLGLETPKLADLQLLYAAYQQALDGLGWQETAELERRLAAALAGDGDWQRCSVLAGVTHVVVEELNELSPARRQLLAALVGRLPGVQWRIGAVYEPERPRLYAGIEQVLAQEPWRSAARQATAGLVDNSLGRAATLLFSGARAAVYEPADARAPLAVIAADHPLAEVEAIAAAIKQLMRDDGLPAESIAVCFTDMETYAPLVREAFPAAGISYSLGVGEPLAGTPAAQALGALLAVQAGNYRRKAVQRLLIAPALQLPGIAGADPRGCADRLERLAQQEGVQAGLEHWQAAARRLAERRQDNAWLAPADWLVTLAERLGPIPEPLTETALAEQMLRWLSDFGIREALRAEAVGVSEDGGLFRQARPARRLAEQQGLRRVERLLGQLARQGGDEAWPREEAEAWWHGVLAAETLAPSRRPPGAVPVLALMETRGIDCEVLVVGGLSDGWFPRVYHADLFIGEEQRQGLGLRTRTVQQVRERYLFHQLLHRPRRRLVLAHPRTDGAADLLPSPFLLELKRLVPWEAVATSDRPLSTKAWQRRLAQDVLVGQGEGLECLRGGLAMPDAAPDLQHLQRMLALAAARSAFLQIIPDHEGFLSSAAARERLAGRGQRQAPFSLSQLETYHRCPFRYAAQYVLGLGEPVEADEELDAGDRGTLLHNILAEFHRRWGSRPLIPAARDEARELLTGLARELLAEPRWADRAGDAHLHQAELFGVGRRPGQLELFLEVECSRQDGFQPAYLEWAFGGKRYLEGSDPASSPDPLFVGDAAGRGFWFQGRIDRIDRSADGRQAVVYDYKSGSFLPYGLVGDGDSWQLPLYMRAVGEMLGLEVVAGRYYHLKDPLQHGKSNYLVRADQRARLGIGPSARMGILDDVALAGLLLNAASLAATAAERLRAGRFPPLPRDGERECQRCPYRAICRVDARKAGAWRGALEEAL